MKNNSRRSGSFVVVDMFKKITMQKKSQGMVIDFLKKNLMIIIAKNSKFPNKKPLFASKINSWRITGNKDIFFVGLSKEAEQ